MEREVAAERSAGDDDADGSVRPVLDRGSGANEFSAAVQWFNGLPVAAARGHPARQPIGEGTHVPARQRRRLHGYERLGTAARLDPVDFHETEPTLRHL